MSLFVGHDAGKFTAAGRLWAPPRIENASAPRSPFTF